MDLGMHSLALDGARQAALLVAIGILLFILATGVVGLRWGSLLFAAYLPIALMSGPPTKPGAAGVVALTFGSTTLLGVFSGQWPPYPMLGGLLPLALLLVPRVVNWQPPAGIAWLFSWRLFAPVITVSMVSMFMFVMADNLLFIIWPEAALIPWIDERILTPLFR
jgi:hypothetical protein